MSLQQNKNRDKKEFIMDIYTQYTYEKKWLKTSQDDVLRMISEEMPETDAQSTLLYILSEISKGKTITLGTCRFRNY